MKEESLKRISLAFPLITDIDTTNKILYNIVQNQHAVIGVDTEAAVEMSRFGILCLLQVINYYVGSINTFHSECTDDSLTNYLIVRALDTGDCYFKFNDYVGAKISLADLRPGTTDLLKLDYSPISRANSLNRRDYAIHVFILPCTDGSEIIANLLYAKKNLKTKGEVSPIGSGYVDYSFKFNGDNQLKITYSAAQYQFALAIFTPNSDVKVNFNVKFEGKTIGMDNKDKHIFTRTDDSSKDLIITAR